MRIVRRLLMLLLLGVVGFYSLACGFLYAEQQSILYPAPETPHLPNWKDGQLLRINGADGHDVVAAYIPAAEGQPTLVHFHGNGEQLSQQRYLGWPLHAAGVGFLAVEYPGYALAADSGPPNEQKVYDAADVALRYLRDELHVPTDKTVLCGRSLGTGVAMEMARRGYGAKLILISPYTSIPEVAKRIFPLAPIGLLAKDKFESLRKAPDVKIPALVIHGTQDDVIPFDMGQAVSKALPHAEFVPVEGAHHNDVDRLGVMDKVVQFAQSH